MSGQAALRETSLRWYFLLVVFCRQTARWDLLYINLSLPSSGFFMKYNMQIMQQLTREKTKERLVFSPSADSRRTALSAAHEPEAFVSLGLMFTTSCTSCQSSEQIQNGSELKSLHLGFTSKQQVLFRHLVLGDGVEGEVELEAQVR